MTVRRLLNYCLFSSLLIADPSLADTAESYDACLLNAAKNLDSELTLKQIRNQCNQVKNTNTAQTKPTNLIKQRLQDEHNTTFNRFVITPHHMNYFLPIVMTDSINNEAYYNSLWSGKLKNVEAEFQVSFKTPLSDDDLFVADDGLFAAFTLKSYWQVYAGDISRPFRETNYRPELFYLAPTPWTPFDSSTWAAIGIEHQSNGRTQGLSRSWNRIYANLIVEKDNFVFSFNPWWRIKEEPKQYPESPKGDDNPDIEDYMGHFQINAIYKWQDYKFSFTGRQNFTHHKGFGELGITFPLWGKFRGYAKYSTGYGDNLIDYNHKQQRLGIGVALTDTL